MNSVLSGKATLPSGKAVLCKSAMSWFDSSRRLKFSKGYRTILRIMRFDTTIVYAMTIHRPTIVTVNADASATADGAAAAMLNPPCPAGYPGKINGNIVAAAVANRVAKNALDAANAGIAAAFALQ